MATFAPRDDGLFNVTLDNGVTLPMPLSEAQLMGAGASPVAPPAPEPQLYSDAGAPPEPGPDMRTADLSGQVGMSLMPQPAPQQPAMVPIPPQQAPPEPGSMLAPQQAKPRELERPRPVGTPHGAPGAPGQPQQQGQGLAEDPLVQAVVMQNLGGGGGPAVRVPARDVRASFQVKPGKPLPEGYLEREAELGQKEDRAVSDTAEALYRGRAGEQQLMEKRTLDMQRDIDAQQAQRARTDEQLARAAYTIRERQMDAENVKDIDPNRWVKKNTFAAIMGVVGMALLEAAKAGGGGGNMAKDLLTEAIESDIASQREHYARAKDKVGEARNVYAELVAVHGSPQRAEEELRLRMEALADKQLQLQAHKTGSEQIIINAEAQLAQNRLQREQRWLELTRSTQADVVENYQHQPARVVGGGGRRDIGKALSAGAQAAKDLKEIRGGGKLSPAEQRVMETQYGRVVVVEGKKFYAPDEKRAKEYQGVVDVLPQLTHNMTRQREIIRKGAQSATPGDRAELGALTQRNKMLMKQLETLGAITAADQELVSPLVGEGAEKILSLDSSTERVLDAALEHARMRMNAAQRNIFYEPELNTPLAAPPPPSVR
jgi:hypothetical protein